MKLVLASRNKGKIREIEALLRELVSDKISVLSLDDIGYFGDIIEDGESFEENALIKASVPAKLGYYGVADDSGLAVDALDGAPGIYSARYAGEEADYAKNNAKLLSELDRVHEEDRTARFVSVVAFVYPDGRRFTVRGECVGEIISEYRGKGGFGYDPLFLYPPMNKTFSEMTEEEKNSVSHRGVSMRLFAEEFKARFADELR